MQDGKRNQIVHYLLNIGIIILLFLGAFFGTRPPHVTISENYIKISGFYGVELRMEDIEQLEIRESLPRIVTRTNGLDWFGIAKRGIYELEELGRTRLIDNVYFSR